MWSEDVVPRIGLAALLAAAISISCSSLDDHFAPDFVIVEPTYPEAWTGPQPIKARHALKSAVRSLEERGVRDVRLCKINWMVAGVGCALVRATGRWEFRGVHFDAFTVGVYDGTEEKSRNPGGKTFFVAAHGIDDAGRETWYDSAGYADDPHLFRYDELTDDDALRFEMVDRGEMLGLPTTRGMSGGPPGARDLH
jgi:hypothetical protein